LKPVKLRKVAKRDLREATAWYAERDIAVARRFTDEVTRTLELIEEFPSTGAPVPSVPDPEIRRLPVHNFPYHVVFIELATRVSVLAVAHDRRRPGYWR
jgi:plasmid stabilization system protein ParE